MPPIETIKKEYPLHWLVWHNNYSELEDQLSNHQLEKEKLDCRGRTPLMLAVTLGHAESVRVLLRHDCNVMAENQGNWTALQEAVSTGDPELVQMLLERRDHQRHSKRVGGIPQLLQQLKEAPDFFVEMKWEFTSWVPLVSRMCPSDSYKVYKQGSNVRIDTTLLGFDQTSWQRGNRSYIFKGSCDNAVMMEVDHERMEVYTEEMHLLPADVFPHVSRSADAVTSRLTSPIVTTYIDTEKINFERNKTGIWGWRSDKEEQINGYNCKVFSATNVELVTKTRTEHLTGVDRERARTPRTALQSFLGIAETEHRSTTPDPSDHEDTYQKTNPSNITAEEYFDSTCNIDGRDIGRPKEILSKVQKFRATLWLCEDYPLTLQEQIMPIVDLMAISSPHFAKLKDFIQLQLPAGFPVKIEIPLFHVLHARITFGNIFGLDSNISGITRLEDDDGKLSCFVNDTCFEPPAHYTRIGGDSRSYSMEDEDGLMQFAIQQSLVETGSDGDEVDIWEALRAQRPVTPNLGEERELQRAIQASLRLPLGDRTSPDGSTDTSPDEDLLKAILVSKNQLEEEERRRKEDEESRRIEEEAILERIIQLSLTEK